MRNSEMGVCVAQLHQSSRSLISTERFVGALLLIDIAFLSASLPLRSDVMKLLTVATLMVNGYWLCVSTLAKKVVVVITAPEIIVAERNPASAGG